MPPKPDPVVELLDGILQEMIGVRAELVTIRRTLRQILSYYKGTAKNDEEV